LELLFIRHGQGEHNLDVPDRLSIEHPYLTDKGKDQVAVLIPELSLDPDVLFVVSPTVRTLETARILTANCPEIRKFTSAAVGPRMFPQNPAWLPAICDQTLSIETIEGEYPDFTAMHRDSNSLWTAGVNTLEQDRFAECADQLIQCIKAHRKERAIIVSHDGTITNYRMLLGEQGLTREDFLGEAGTYKIIL
jgi:broad specificity phosphatase PhoE